MKPYWIAEYYRAQLDRLKRGLFLFQKTSKPLLTEKHGNARLHSARITQKRNQRVRLSYSPVHHHSPNRQIYRTFSSWRKISHYVRRIFYFKIALILQKGNGKFVRERERQMDSNNGDYIVLIPKWNEILYSIKKWHYPNICVCSSHTFKRTWNKHGGN